MSEKTAIIALTVAVIFVMISMIVFMTIYRKKANKRLNEAKEGIASDTRTIMPPIKFFILMLIATTIVTVILLLAFTGVMSFGYKVENISASGYTINISGWKAKDLEKTPFSEYKEFGSNIKGYTMHTKQDGNIIINYYLLDNTSLRFLPTALFAVKYTGDKEVTELSVTAERIADLRGTIRSERGSYPEEDNYLYTIDINDIVCDVDISIELYDYVYEEYLMSNYEPGVSYEEMPFPSPFETYTLSLTAEELFGEGCLKTKT